MDNVDKRASYFAIITGLLIVVSNIQSLFGYNAQTMDVFMGMTLILVGCYSWFGSKTRKGAFIYTCMVLVTLFIEVTIILLIGSITNSRLIALSLTYLILLVVGIISIARQNK